MEPGSRLTTSPRIVGVSETSDAFSGEVRPGKVFCFFDESRMTDFSIMKSATARLKQRLTEDEERQQ